MSPWWCQTRRELLSWLIRLLCCRGSKVVMWPSLVIYTSYLGIRSVLFLPFLLLFFFSLFFHTSAVTLQFLLPRLSFVSSPAVFLPLSADACGDVLYKSRYFKGSRTETWRGPGNQFCASLSARSPAFVLSAFPVHWTLSPTPTLSNKNDDCHEQRIRLVIW